MRPLSRRQSGLQACSGATTAILIAVAALAAPALAAAAQKNPSSRFKYVGGTEKVPYECVGTVQILDNALAFRCDSSVVTMPYRDIETMQYRADVTRRVRKMKVRWTAIPPEHTGGGKNLYFTLIYRASGLTQVLILEVPEDQMRPYLAEIDLKAGRRVEVQSHENYSP
jgi:hypothetical protein